MTMLQVGLRMLWLRSLIGLCSLSLQTRRGWRQRLSVVSAAGRR